MKRFKCSNCRRLVRPALGKKGYTCPLCGWYPFDTCDDPKCGQLASGKCEVCKANCCDEHLSRVKRGWHGDRHRVIDARQMLFGFEPRKKPKSLSKRSK